MIYTIKRGDYTLLKAELDGKQTRAKMGEDIVEVEFELPYKIDFQKNDMLQVYGNTYLLDDMPVSATKLDNSWYDYRLRFVAEWYRVTEINFCGYDSTNQLSESETDFELMADADTLLTLIIANLNRVDSGWTKGDVEQTDVRLLSFSDESCMQVLTRTVDEFNTEFSIEGKTIHIKKVRPSSGLSFKQGVGKGLISISKNKLEDKKIKTKLFAFGGDKNLPSDYKNRAGRLTIAPIIDNAKVAKYGISEGYYYNKNIYPRRIGTVTSTSNHLTFSDSALNFNVNNQMISEDIKAKVTFTTGLLAGYMFEVKSYVHSSRTFNLLVNENEKAFVIPSETIKPAVGDKYFVTDIIMPASYITAAENELASKAQEKYNIVSEENYSIHAPTDPFFIEGLKSDLELGSTVNIQDNDLGINGDLAILSYSRDLQNPYLYDLTLSDNIEVSQIVRDIIANEETQRIINLAKLNDIARLRLAWRTSQELKNMIYDTDNYFDMENIRPLSIETSMLSVGAKSTNFTLNIQFSPNVSGNQNVFSWSNGVLTHPVIEDSPRTWNIAAGSNSSLSTNTAYYIYARVPIVGNNGIIQVTTTQYQVDSQSGYYTLLIGVLHSASNGYRVVSLTYGTTDIVGNQIKTGVISSNDGTTYINLNTGEIRGSFTFTSGEDVEESVNNLEQDITGIYQDITDLNNDLTDLDNYIEGAFSDNIIQESEAIAIEKYINSLTSEKSAIDNKFTVIYGDSLLSGTPKSNLNSAKNAFNTAHSNLISSINTAIADGKTTPTEKSDVDNKFTTYKSSIATLNTRFEEAVNFISQKKADAAESNAKERIKITPFTQGTGKIFNRPASLGINSDSNVGYLVISTPITSAYMTRVKVVGYNYVGDNSDIDLTVSFYAYTSNQFHQTSYTNIGNYPISDIQLARDSSGRTIVIIGKSSSVWRYPKIVVESAAIGQNNPPDSYADDWSMEITTNISAYTNNSVIDNGLDVQTETEASKAMLTDISSDSKITPSEKQQVQIEWNSILSEKLQIANQATNYGISKADYEQKYADLDTYITPILSNLNTTTNIVGSTFRTNFSNYYVAREVLLKNISDKAKQLSDNAQTAADNADSKAQDVKDKTGVDSLPTGKVIIENGKISADLITAVGAVTAGSFNIGSGKFKVSADGKLEATEAKISGEITATSGKIGEFTITSGGRLTAGSNDPGDNLLTLAPGEFLFRRTGTSTSRRIEALFGYAGLGVETGLYLRNNKETSLNNSALQLNAYGGINNYALEIINGNIRTNGKIGMTTKVYMKVEMPGQGGDNWNSLTFDNGILVQITTYDVP